MSNLALLNKVSTRRLSAQLLAVLREQNPLPSERQNAYLSALEKGEAVCIFTGQQVGLGLGPLLTIYKILSVLDFVRREQQKCEKTLVPMFWVQSEDHDLAEIDSLFVVDKEGEGHKLSLFSQDEQKLNRRSVGVIKIPERIDALLDALGEFAPSVTEPPGIELLRRHYLPGRTFAQAFMNSIRELFGDKGLLLFDPRSPRVQEEGKSLFQRALNERIELNSLLSARTAELEQGGNEGFVRLRNNSPLFFYHPEGPNGSRFRLEEQERGRFAIPELSLTISEQELAAKIDSSPSAFSSSALLRPLVQNFLFPTYAYIGGPAELRYWRQIEPLHEQWHIPFPLVLARKRALLLEPKVRRLIEQIGLRNDQLSQSPKELEATLLAQTLPNGLDPKRFEASLHEGPLRQMRDFLSALGAQDSSMASELARSQEKVERAIQGFLDKFQELSHRKGAVALERLERLNRFISPQGIPQERICAFAGFWCKYAHQLVAAIESSFEGSEADFLLTSL